MPQIGDTLGIVDALMLWLAAGVSIDPAAVPHAIWSHQAIDDKSADPYTLVRGYGNGGNNVAPTQLVQMMTKGKDLRTAMRRAQDLHEFLIDVDAQPKRNFALAAATLGGIEVPAFRVVGIIAPDPPQHVDTIEDGRVVIVSKFTAVYHRVQE